MPIMDVGNSLESSVMLNNDLTTIDSHLGEERTQDLLKETSPNSAGKHEIGQNSTDCPPMLTMTETQSIKETGEAVLLNVPLEEASFTPNTSDQKGLTSSVVDDERGSDDIAMGLRSDSTEESFHGTTDEVPISAIDEESESDDDHIFEVRRKKTAILSDDDEASTQISNLGEDFSSEKEEEEPGMSSLKEKRRILTHDSDSEGSVDDLKIESQPQEKVSQIKYRSDVFDTEETDDDDDEAAMGRESPSLDDSDSGERQNPFSHSQKSNKTLGASKKNKSLKPSVKDRQKELKEIHSTTQKMIRESEVSLPYHRPKQRTLKEFLNRIRPSVQSERRKSLKMSMKDPDYLKEIEDRKKDVDKFFKSDSEDEEDWIENENKEENPEEKQMEVDLNECGNKDAAKRSLDFDLPDLESSKVENDYYTVHETMTKSPEKSQDDKSTMSTSLVPSLEEVEKQVVSEAPLKDNSEELMDCIPSLKFFNCDEEKDQADIELEKLEFKEKESLPHFNYKETENDEDLILHLNTEDFNENSNDSISLEKEISSSVKDLGECNPSEVQVKDNSCEDTPEPTSKIIKNITPKLNLLSKKFPNLNINKLSNVTPKLSLGGTEDFVDLDEDLCTPRRQQGVSDLFSRFVKHSTTKKKLVDAHQVTLGVVSKEVSAEGEEKLVHSNISVDIDAEKETGPKEEVPGARLTKLKQTLRARLLEQRERDRQRREKEKEFYDSEKVIQDYHDDGLPDEEPELTDQSDTDYETESEPEENDVIIKDKKRKKNKYLDEEAEVDDDESDEGKDNDEREERCEEENDSNNEDEESNVEDEEVVNFKTSTKRKINRIIDDDDDDEVAVVAYPNTSESENLFKGLTNDVQVGEQMSGTSAMYRASTEDLFSSQTQESSLHSKKDVVPNASSLDSSLELYGSVLPGHQPMGGGLGSKNEPLLSDTQEITASLTPFSKLENMRRESFTEESAFQESLKRQSAISFLLTPTKDSKVPSTSSIKRTLLLESPAKKSNEKEQANNSELLDLCSGNFAADSGKKSNFSQDSQPTSQSMADLVGLCSGQFKTQVPSASQEFSTGYLNATSEANSISDSGLSTTDSQNKLDETVLLSHCSESVAENSGESAKAPVLHIYSSDEDEVLDDWPQDHTRKKRKRILNLSDDEESESSENEEMGEEEEILEFDEDEQPIRRQKFGGFKDQFRGGIRSDFLDKEAELSGSEEGSDDEEEPGEDEDLMEREEGDLDNFDEEELRNEVGKAHMKSVIDQDKREVRLLQEMYLEDGDLHGQGRQRKFRWRNVDDSVDTNDVRSDDEEREEEMEEEAEWRKQRFEREKFLLEQKKNTGDGSPSPLKLQEIIPSLERSSSSLKLVRSQSLTKAPLKPLNSTCSQDSDLHFDTSRKRGSFLSRDQSTLKRLVEFTKENHTVGSAKQGGNFVFHTLTEEEVEKRAKERRKAVASNPPRKMRKVERSFFSMDDSVKATSVFNLL